ncbi:Uu.00g144870.m01.CDS01 [Anthostomella pinea]|uniref:Uu.00g144870.m01.CDS01 n=1 Tax=Anthostomella pinea TaxID=933095 RepID=A0AAI8VQX0_9PEZI|nr:Uu.00g144870.m01.CDS01 [Anthostomella pinea]
MLDASTACDAFDVKADDGADGKININISGNEYVDSKIHSRNGDINSNFNGGDGNINSNINRGDGDININSNIDGGDGSNLSSRNEPDSDLETASSGFISTSMPTSTPALLSSSTPTFTGVPSPTPSPRGGLSTSNAVTLRFWLPATLAGVIATWITPKAWWRCRQRAGAGTVLIFGDDGHGDDKETGSLRPWGSAKSLSGRKKTVA